MISDSVIVFSTADWASPAWTNKQHVASTLANLGYKVLYIDGIGIRKPTLTSQDTSRIARRLAKLARPMANVRENIWVLSLPFLPFHNNKLALLINKCVISSGIYLCRKLLRLRDPILWTYHPLTTLWLSPERYTASLYHCVDEIGAQPGMPSSVIDLLELNLAKRVNYVCTTAPILKEKLMQANRCCEFLPNVADYDHFSQARDLNVEIPSELHDIKEPRLGFVGAISGYKVDINLLFAVARARPEWSIVLIGEIGLGDTRFRLEDIPANVHVLGTRPYQTLPKYLKGFSVGLLPYCINEYTKGVFPMKLFEYMAAGLPVVTTRLPALVQFGAYVEWATTAEQFIDAIEISLREDCDAKACRAAIAESNTYKSRTLRMLESLDRARSTGSLRD